MKSLLTLSLSFALACAGQSSANAELIISDWNMTPTQTTFRINGTIDPGFTPSPLVPDRLYIGEPNVAGWFSSFSSATFTPDVPPAVNDRNLDTLSIGNFGGESAFFIEDSANPAAWAACESINGLFAFDATFTPGVIDEENLVISVGYGAAIATPLEDPNTYVGSFQAATVPEPASIAVWSLIGLALGGFGYYRLRGHKG